ncbi:uncharacterized protein LOC108134675 [Drosophila elegans]|uniref:uncharacterized protein LOC108134675 n=1 Tax=Drosophila elegans TaxID=30023 RepID=UPI0007E7E19B|nr:uncharacterized protein LOC108134675 [Drosophila elegans]
MNFWAALVYYLYTHVGGWNFDFDFTPKPDLSEYQKIGTRYFIIERNVELNWTDAERACQEKRGHLASIKDEEEKFAFMYVIKDYEFYWLGINDRDNKGEYMSVASGKKAPYLKLKKYNPSPAPDNERCVWLFDNDMTDGRYAERACQEKRGHLASIKDVEEEFALMYMVEEYKFYWLGINDRDNKGEYMSVASGKKAPYLKWTLVYYLYIHVGDWSFDFTPKPDLSEYQKIGKRYFIIEHNVELSWSDAERACQEKRGHLASIKDEEEGFAFMYVVEDYKFYWLGINDRDNKGEYMSVASGKKAPYINWHEYNPSPEEDNERCVTLYSNYMFDRRCEVKSPYICQADTEF